MNAIGFLLSLPFRIAWAIIKRLAAFLAGFLLMFRQGGLR